MRVKLVIVLCAIISVIGVIGKPWIVQATGINRMSVGSRLELALVLAIVAAGLVFYLRSKAKNKSDA
jgi:hypothetical protein